MATSEEVLKVTAPSSVLAAIAVCVCSLTACGREEPTPGPGPRGSPSLAASAPAKAQPSDPGLLSLSSEDGDWRLSITFDRASYRLAEPVNAVVSVRNLTKDDRRIAARLDPAYGDVRVVVADSGGATREFSPLTLVEASARGETVAAGGEVSARFPIYFGASGWTFPSAGEYQVHAVWRERLHASARIGIASPEGAEREQAALMLNEPEVGKFLIYGGASSLTRGEAVLERIVAENADTVLAAHAQMGLGENLVRPAIRASDPMAAEQGLQYLQRAAARFSSSAQPDAFLHATESLMTASANLKRQDLAASVKENLSDCARSEVCLAAIRTRPDLMKVLRAQ